MNCFLNAAEEGPDAGFRFSKENEESQSQKSQKFKWPFLETQGSGRSQPGCSGEAKQMLQAWCQTKQPSHHVHYHCFSCSPATILKYFYKSYLSSSKTHLYLGIREKGMVGWEHAERRRYHCCYCSGG